MSIVVQQLVHRYASSDQGLLGVSLGVERGELVAVIGASGCGKSTLLRVIAGLIPVQSGRLLIDGQDVAGAPPWQRSVGMVFQSYALFPHLSVIDNVAYGLRMRDVDKAERIRRARAMISAVGLEGLEARRPSQLSGGQQQRVALARALAFRPSVLLLDEPLAALDAHIRTQLCDRIREAQRASGAATLFVTHDQQEALMIADRIAVLHCGRLQQIDTPKDLYARPANLVVARFVGNSNLIPSTVIESGVVRTAIGDLRVSTGDRQIGSQSHVLIRPETARPDPPVDSPNRIAGTPGRVRFMGATCRWDFHPNGLGPVGLTSKETILCEGSVVAQTHVSLDPEALLLVDQDDCPQ
jgi:putative spermidine/putrescine transport system ATP-binding protein